MPHVLQDLLLCNHRLKLDWMFQMSISCDIARVCISVYHLQLYFIPSWSVQSQLSAPRLVFYSLINFFFLNHWDFLTYFQYKIIMNSHYVLYLNLSAGMEPSKWHSLTSLLFILNCLSKTLVITISNCQKNKSASESNKLYSVYQFLLINKSRYIHAHLDAIANCSNDSFKNNDPELLNQRNYVSIPPWTGHGLLAE